MGRAIVGTVVAALVVLGLLWVLAQIAEFTISALFWGIALVVILLAALIVGLATARRVA